jgi:hypothetical protein
MKLRVRRAQNKRHRLHGVREPLSVAVGPQPGVVAFAWYSKGTWEQLRRAASDPEALDNSYEEWLGLAEDGLQRLEAQGVAAERFPLDVSAAAAWADQQGRPFDSAARAAYVAVMVRNERA